MNKNILKTSVSKLPTKSSLVSSPSSPSSPSKTSINITFLIIAIIFITLGVLSFISASSSLSTIDDYPDTTSAKIIGSLTITSSPNNQFPQYQTIYEYSYRNVLYRSVLVTSTFRTPGEIVTIRINPKNPEDFSLNNYTQPFNLGKSVLFSAIVLLVIGGLIYYTNYKKL